MKPAGEKRRKGKYAAALTIPLAVVQALLFAHPVAAQTSTSSDVFQYLGGLLQKRLQDSVTLEASEMNPDPESIVTVDVVSYSFDRYQTNFQWYLDGSYIADSSGRGRTSIRFLAGKNGVTRTVRVDVTPAGESTISKSLTITSLSLPLYWWTNTEVPYWYKGKALPSVGSEVTVLALAPSPQSVSYKWFFNGSVVSQGSGSQTLTFPMHFPVKERIGVEVTNPILGLEKSTEISVPPVQPVVELYELRPLRGIVSERALSNFQSVSGEPHDFAALTFFFPKIATQDLRYEYTWNLSGKTIPGRPPRPWIFELSSNLGEQTSDRLSVTVSPENPRQAGTEAHRGITVDLR